MPRPKGSLNKPYDILIPNWQPLTWKPVYDQMIALHIAGRTNVEIAELLDYTQVQVGNILRSKMGKQFIKEVIERIRQHTSSNVNESIEQFKEAAVGNVGHVILDKDGEFKKNAPFKHAEMSMSFLKGIGFLSDGANKTTINHNVLNVVSKEVQDDIRLALKEANELQVKRLTDGSDR